MEWHALSCGNVLYFPIDEIQPGGGCTTHCHSSDS
jgi:hypothetical protein